MAQKVLVYNERDILKMIEEEVEQQMKKIKEDIFKIKIRLVDLEGMIKCP
jgi:hypothetical protein